MYYSELEIENLNKIIAALIKNSIGTVPEILYGYGVFPAFNSIEDLDCRRYEDTLIDNELCSIADGWTPNSIPSGFKLMYLDQYGRKIVHSKISIKDFLEQKKKDKQQSEAQRYGSIHIHGGNAVIGSNNSGVFQAQSGALINTGYKAHIDIDNHIEVNKGNFKALEQKLSDSYIAQQDIEKLKSILISDNPNEETGFLGEKTNGWISKMISKSLDGTWQIGVGAAGGLLVEIIKKFYGWL